MPKKTDPRHAYVLYEDSTAADTRHPKLVRPKDGHFQRAQMQEIVGGYVVCVCPRQEILWLFPGYQLWVNEEGRRKGLRLNTLASFVAGQPIVGNALLCLDKQVQ